VIFRETWLTLFSPATISLLSLKTFGVSRTKKRASCFLQCLHLPEAVIALLDKSSSLSLFSPPPFFFLYQMQISAEDDFARHIENNYLVPYFF